MAISIIRKLTEEDNRRLNAASYRFARRWRIDTSEFNAPYEAVSLEVQYHEQLGRYGNTNMVRAWRKVFARALREKPCKALATGYGYVGFYVD